MLSRRNAIRNLGLGTGSLALAPFFRHMKLHAAGDVTKLPKRFLFVVKDNGLRPYGLQPVGWETSHGAGPASSKSVEETPLKDLQFNWCMKSLEPFKDQINVIQGLSNSISAGNHTGKYGALGSYSSTGMPLDATIDGELSNLFPSIFPHVGFEGNRAGKMITYPAVTATGPKKKASFYANATMAYGDLFGSVVKDPNVKKTLAAGNNILDFLIDDVKRARTKLAGEEREKLGHYLQGFESLRDRKVKLSKLEGLEEHAPKFDDKYSSDIDTHQLEAMGDMATAALISGITNVATICCDNLGTTMYDGIGLSQNLHGIGHYKESGADGKGFDPNAKEPERTGWWYRHKIRSFHMEMLARAATQLKSVPEGDGTMLDNTLIVYLSHAGGSHPGGCTPFPFLTIGNINGKLKTGRHFWYPSKGHAQNRTAANFYLSLLHAAGKPRENFGVKDASLSSNQDGPLAELMA
jgi:hypothetical protein